MWGLFVLWRLPALEIAKIGAVLGNIALGFSALALAVCQSHADAQGLRPHWCCRSASCCAGSFSSASAWW